MSCVAIVGGGPAGLMAAEVLAESGTAAVHVYDAMPSVGRKFLLAGKGGLNLTHGEPLRAFVSRYGARAAAVAPWLDAFGADATRTWAAGLGIDTFVGTSGRVFPTDLKAAPLLRAWLHRLRERGVRFHMRHRWLGLAGDDGALRFAAPQGEVVVQPRATVLALGGASWPQLGSDGAWVPWLRGVGAEVAPLAPANCGFEVTWSEHLRTRFAGAPIKPVVLRFEGFERQGEFVLSDYGLEGSLVYAASAPIRDAIAARGQATITLDLLPDHDADRVRREVAHPRGSRSLGSHLKSRLGLEGAKVELLHELLPRETFADAARLAAAIKALPITLAAARPIAEAISSAGGVTLESLDDHLMLRSRPGIFCAGEMLDWEAPTGGYLLQASMASGRVAGQGAAAYLSCSRDR
jgi:uncharacterized flavoprotein (TIGR03862 family)